MRVIFLGTPDFSREVLSRIYKSGHKVVLAVCNPDKAGSRGKTMPSPVKSFCEENGIKLRQYAKVSKDGIDELRAVNADIMVTAAFGQILSDEVLALCRYGVINVHASLLPKYRGASPIQHAILNGDRVTGVTIMQTVKEVDAGDVILMREMPINNDDNAGTLFERLAVLGGKSAVEALDLIEQGKAVFTPQNHKQATFTGMIKKEDGRIDFNKTADEIGCFVRAMYPWPSAYTYIQNKIIKVLLTKRVTNNKMNIGACAGTVICADEKQGLFVACGDGEVEIEELQSEGKKRMSARDYLRGNPIEVGTVLG